MPPISWRLTATLVLQHLIGDELAHKLLRVARGLEHALHARHQHRDASAGLQYPQAERDALGLDEKHLGQQRWLHAA